MSNGYDRWCPSCGVWVKPDDLRVRDDGSGLKRHVTCEAVTSPTKITAGEHVLLDSSGGKSTQKCTCDTGWDHYAVPVSTLLGDLVPQVITTTLREDAAEALAALEKHAVDPDTGAAPVTRSTTASDSWGLPDLAETGDCTLSQDNVLVHDTTKCSCDSPGPEFGHQEWCGWSRVTGDVAAWLKKLAPGVRFFFGDASGPQLRAWDGKLYDRPGAPEIQDAVQTAEIDAPEAGYMVYALVRIPDEVVSRDE